jgi:hypothetical protein
VTLYFRGSRSCYLVIVTWQVVHPEEALL